MKSAGNGGILKGILQVLHIHILFVAPLGACHMAQPCTDQHQGRVTIRETAHHTGAAANLPVQPLNDIVGADTAPVFTGEIAVGQSLLNAIFYLLCGLFQLHSAQFLRHSFGPLPGCFLALLSVDRFEHLGHNLYLGAGRYRENIAVKVDGTPLVCGFGEHFPHGLQHTEAFVSHNEFHAIQTTAAEPLEETDPASLVLFHALSST